jgi:sigma-B regulation protein RsbU (phosphoserine phosphatase)
VSIDFKQNDLLFLITDGILESRNAAGEQFGVNGLENSIKSITSSDDTIEKIQTDFRAFTGNQFEDDVSLITIKAI